MKKLTPEQRDYLIRQWQTFSRQSISFGEIYTILNQCTEKEFPCFKMTEELKPCNKCGGSPELNFNSPPWWKFWVSLSVYVECVHCGYQGPHYNFKNTFERNLYISINNVAARRDSAIKAWNEGI